MWAPGEHWLLIAGIMFTRSMERIPAISGDTNISDKLMVFSGSNTGQCRFRGIALVSDTGNYIYAFNGSSKPSFWRYDIAMNSWSDVRCTNPTRNVGSGGSLTYVAGSSGYISQLVHLLQPCMIPELQEDGGILSRGTFYHS